MALQSQLPAQSGSRLPSSQLSLILVPPAGGSWGAAGSSLGVAAWLLEGVFSLCQPLLLLQPAPHQGPGAQAVGDAAAGDRGPADHWGKAAAQRQLVSGESGWMLRETPALTYFASLKDFEVFLANNKVTEQNRHRKMTCGIGSGLQEMEENSVSPGFGEFPCVEAERWDNPICFFCSLVGLLSELIDILVEVNITANIKCTNFESGTFQVVTEDCLCILGAIKVKVLSG